MSIRRVFLPLVPALATLALLLGGCGALGDDDQSPTASDTRKTKKPDKGGESTASEPAASESATPEPSGEETTVPAYFVGETPQGPRLYREFQRVQGDPLLSAAQLATSGKSLDPDYRAAFPAGDELVSVEHDGDQIAVQLASDAWADRPSDMSEAQASLAVQSLVYTLQGAAQSRDAVVVVGSSGGDPVTLLGVSTPVKNKPPLDVLAMVNITTPGEGDAVSGTFTASGVASSFEANVPWQVREAESGEVVMDGFATAEGWMDKLYPWQTEVDVSQLSPGFYEFVARTDDPSGGEGGGPTEDTKTFVVE